MNLIGAPVKLLACADPTQSGLSGRLVLETANTFLLESGSRTFVVQKRGTVFRDLSTNAVLAGADLAGRLEDRIGGRGR